MIKFSIDNLKLQQIYIASIQSNGLLRYYTSVNQFKMKKKPLTKRVSPSIFNKLVSKRYFGVSILEYKIPRISYLFYVGEEVVDVDICEVKRSIFEIGKGYRKMPLEEFNEKIAEYCEEMESSIEKLKLNLKNAFDGEELYTDGKFVFDLKNSKLNRANMNLGERGRFISISKDKSFYMGAYRAVYLTLNQDAEKYERKRYVAIYSAKDSEGKEINVYFPSTSEKLIGRDFFEKMEEESFVNLRFMTNFVKKYSKLFSYKDLEELKVEETILDLGVLSLREIDEVNYDYYIFSEKVLPVVAWLARLTYKSKNIAQLNAIGQVMSKLFESQSDKKGIMRKNFFITHYMQLDKVTNNEIAPELVDINQYLNMAEKVKDMDLDLFSDEEGELELEDLELIENLVGENEELDY